MPLPENLRTGYRGEQLTGRFLRERGYRILCAGFRSNLGETDIIALSPDGVLCFVEVKTRAPGGLNPPADAVDRDKRERLVNNAAAFIKTKIVEYRAVRFEIAEVILYDLQHAEINLIENAFGQEAFGR